jgi:hypothetical protein
MNEQQLCKLSEIEKLLDITTVTANDWSNESSRLYLAIKMLFDNSFLSS